MKGYQQQVDTTTEGQEANGLVLRRMRRWLDQGIEDSIRNLPQDAVVEKSGPKLGLDREGG